MSHQQTTDQFYGTIFTADSMKPDPIKVQTLQDLPTPQNQKQLQSFLELVNYLQPFLPDIPAKTTFLREQVSQGIGPHKQIVCISTIKQWICNTFENNLSLLQ